MSLAMQTALRSQTPVSTPQGSSIAAPLDESRLVSLTGNVAPETRVAQDLGEVAPGTPIHRIQLVLARSSSQSSELAHLLDRQQDPGSTLFHQWLTPADFGRQFGPSDSDVATVTAWLASHGFQQIKVNNGRTLIEFTGTASDVQTAFHTTLHRFSLNGLERTANVSDPSIPEALTPVIAGIASLNNFPRHTSNQSYGSFRRNNKTGAVTPVAAAGTAGGNTQALVAHPELTISSNETYYAIGPYDFATIYDVLPLWNASTPIDGTGQTIAVVGDSDFNPADFVSFRTLFGLPLGNTATSTGTQYLNIIYNGPNPGVLSDEAQADIDTQWAAAVAKGATIDYVASEDTETTAGIDLSAAYIVDNNLAGILADSYSKCELAIGTGGNAFYNALWQQAAAQGITVLMASGDSGDAACDADTGPPAIGGVAVNGLASTPYDTAVGGTEFYAPNGVASYFSSTNNSTTLASALSYIPETTWNDSCADPAFGTVQPYLGLTPEQVCNNVAASSAGLVQVSGSGGGASQCTTSHGGLLSSCGTPYAKPVWQTGAGVPADGARDLPDVSLFASKGRTNSFYIVCKQDQDADGKPCNVSAPYADFAGYGGTGVTAPAFAGILALVAQKTGSRLGNANYALYDLAAQQVAAGTSCASGGSASSACIFHDVTTGTNTQPCVIASPNCVNASQTDAVGILPGYTAGTAYDQTTGLGSVDVANLANNWTKASFHSTSAQLTLTPSSLVHGTPVTATVNVTAASGTPTGSVAIVAQTENGAVGSGALAGGVYTGTLSTLPGGSYGVNAHYSGDQTYAATDSNFVSVTVTPENSTTTVVPLEVNSLTKVATAGVTSAPYGSVFYIRANVAGLSGQGTPTGNVLIDDNGTPLSSGTFRLNSSGYTEAQLNSFLPGTHLITAKYTGDNSFNPSTANSASFTITQAPTTLFVSSSASSLSADAAVTLTATVGTQGYGFYTPSGVATFYVNGTVLDATALVSGSQSGSYTDDSTATLTVPGSLLKNGVNSIEVTYNGDSNYLPSTSNTLSVTVTPPTLITTTTTVSASPTTVLPGGTVTFTANVSGKPTPTGTVQFLVDNQDVGAPVALSAGSAQFSMTVLSLAKLLIPVQTLLSGGTHTVTAVYSGSATEGASISPPATFVVAIPTVASIPVITINPSQVVQGTFVSVQVQITPKSPAPTGTAQLVLDGGLYGGTFNVTNGAVVLPLITSTLQTGTHVVSVFYSGDTTYKPSYASNASLVITAPGATPSTTVLLNVPPQVETGSPLQFNAQVTPSAPKPTGLLEIIVDGGNPGLPTALNGANTYLSLSTNGLAIGQHTVSVFYSGDATYSFSSSATYSFYIYSPGTAPPGSFSISPSSIATVAGPVGTLPPALTFTAVPGTGFNATVSFTCTGLPGAASCIFTPSSFPLSTNPASTVLTFNLSSLYVHNERPSLPWIPASGTVALAGTLLLFVPRRRRRTASLFLCLLIGALAGLSGCGSGFLHQQSSAGTYPVTVTATGGGVTQTATVQLTIQ